jgi:hypothetical protein
MSINPNLKQFAPLVSNYFGTTLLIAMIAMNQTLNKPSLNINIKVN